MSQIDDN
jgi:hypothetical protein